MGLPSTSADIRRARSVARVVVPRGLPSHWVPDGIVDDGSLTPQELDGVDGAVTACAVAIAETGTLILDVSPDQGQRASR